MKEVSDPNSFGKASLETNDIREAVERITVRSDQIEIQLTDTADGEDGDRVLTIPWQPHSTRRRRQIILRTDDPKPPIRAMKTGARDTLIDAMRNARCWLDQLVRDPSLTIKALAVRERKSERSIRMTLSLAFIAPQVAHAAIDGRLPRGFNVKRLPDLPMLWREQGQAVGLREPVKARTMVN